VRERALDRGGERRHIPHMNMCVSRRAYDMMCQCVCGRMCAEDRMSVTSDCQGGITCTS